MVAHGLSIKAKISTAGRTADFVVDCAPVRNIWFARRASGRSYGKIEQLKKNLEKFEKIVKQIKKEKPGGLSHRLRHEMLSLTGRRFSLPPLGAAAQCGLAPSSAV